MKFSQCYINITEKTQYFSHENRRGTATKKNELPWNGPERSFRNFDDLVQKCKDSLPHLSGSGGRDPRAFRCDSPLLALSLFSKRKFAGGVFIQDFINECNKEGKHLIEKVNENNLTVLLPRKCLLGNIEFSCMMVGKVSTNWQVSDAQGNDITIVDKNSDLNVDAEFKKTNY
jgi:hypothetical protein